MSVPNHESSGHSTPLAHVSHLKEMSLASFGTIALTSFLLLLATLFATVIHFLVVGKIDFYPLNLGVFYNYFFRKRDSLYQAKKDIYSWLSLFERAPNFIRTT